MDLHGYHPHTIERTGLIASLVQQSWEMGLSSLGAYSRARLGRPGAPRPVRKYTQHRLAWTHVTFFDLIGHSAMMYHYLGRMRPSRGRLPGIRDGSGRLRFLALNGL